MLNLCQLSRWCKGTTAQLCRAVGRLGNWKRERERARPNADDGVDGGTSTEAEGKARRRKPIAHLVVEV